MKQARTLAILVVVTAIAVAAAIWSQRPERSTGTGGRLFPGLIDKVNAVMKIEVVSADTSLTLKKDEKGWRVVEKDDYPANQEEIRALVVGAAELRRIEGKTGKKELWPKLDLGSPGKGAESIGYTLKDKNDKVLAALIVGKRRLVTRSTDIDQYYVRVPGKERAWLVEGQIPKNRVATDWLATEVVKIAPERVHRTTVRHSDGSVVQAIKQKPGDANFTLLGVPEGRKIDSDFDVHAFATTPADLALNDVTRLENVDFSSPTLSVKTQTFDGLVLTLEFAKHGGHQFFRISASHDPALPELLLPKERKKAATSKNDEKGGAKKKPDAAAEKALKAMKDAPAITAEVERLNRRWAGWAYRVPRYHLNTLRKKIGDFLKPPPKPSKSTAKKKP